MRKGTMPTFKFTGDIDLSSQTNIHVTFAQDNSVVLDIADSDTEHLSIEDNSISVWLEESVSLGLLIGKMEIQINGLSASGKRWASNIMSVPVTKNLLTEPIGERPI